MSEIMEIDRFRLKFENTYQPKSPTQFYSLIHDISLEDDTRATSKIPTDSSDSNHSKHYYYNAGDDYHEKSTENMVPPSFIMPPDSRMYPELFYNNHYHNNNINHNRGKGERRKRLLPETPKKPPKLPIQYQQQQQQNLSSNNTQQIIDFNNANNYNSNNRAADSDTNSMCSSIVVLKCGQVSETDSEFADSGHSTADSPIGGIENNTLKYNLSQQHLLLKDLPENSSITTASSDFGIHHSIKDDSLSFCNSFELYEATHRGLNKFVPRHHDEMEIEIGDPIYVQKEADDLWSEGINLRTGSIGVFPSAYAVDYEYIEWDANNDYGRRERYLLEYLGSVETLAHKGTSVVCNAVRRIISDTPLNGLNILACTLEISDKGLRIVERKRKQNRGESNSTNSVDYFYSLKNVSFCAFHPHDNRYLGFITKHPTLQKFACHVLRGNKSTRPVAEAVGNAFQKFYQMFVDTVFPIEDIYIE